MTLRLARVVDTHPEDHSIDVVMLDDNSRFVGVQVLAMGATTNTGRVALPRPTQTSNKWGQSERTDRDAIAVCAMLAGATNMVCLGFLYPQVNGMLFERQNFAVDRHPSDWYTAIDNDANVEMYHPSGTYLRIAETAAHENLVGQDFDKKWKIEKNTSKSVHVHLTVAAAGVVKATVNIDPAGNIDIEHVGDLSTHTEGNASITIDGDAEVTIGGTADINVTGHTDLTTPDLDITCPSTTFSGAVTIGGNLAVSGGSVTHQGTNIGKTHTHSGVDTGPNDTGPVN